MSLIRWIAGAFATIAWAPSDYLWRRSLRKRTVSLTKKPKLRLGFELEVPKIDIGDGYEWSNTVMIIADDLQRTRDVEVVPAVFNHGFGALTIQTAEWPIVLVSLDRHPDYVAPPRKPKPPKVRTVVDQLGAWNPDEADWAAPAIYQETAYDLMSTLGRMVPEENRTALAGAVADYVLA